MKKTISLILAISLIMSVFVAGTLSASAAEETVIYNFDSLDNVSKLFNTNIAIETNAKTEGTGSLWMNFTKPTGQTANVGGMIIYDFATTQDFSKYDTFKIDVYTPLAMEGYGGLFQVNFVTGKSKQDGYNFDCNIDNIYTGWNTLTFSKSNPTAVADSPDWTQIDRIRVTWFNNHQISRDFMLVDNLRGIVGGTVDESSTPSTTTNVGHTPYAVGDDLMINNADSLDGWAVTDANGVSLFHTQLSTGSQHKEGTGSVTIKSTVPLGQASNIGAMALLNFPATDLSAYSAFSIKVRVGDNLTGGQQLQFNFVTGDGQDGYNYTYGELGDRTAGWYHIVIRKADIPKAVNTADWASINRMRITWFNAAQNNTAISFTFDEIMACKEVPAVSTPSTTSSGTIVTPAAIAPDPYVMEDGSLMINDCDSADGWNGLIGSTIYRNTAAPYEGKACIMFGATRAVGNAGDAGSMAIINYNSFDLTNYDQFSLRVYNYKELPGLHDLQINFITSSVADQDGFNYSFNISDWRPQRWYDVQFSKEDIKKAVPKADWSNIDRIRITWFNFEQLDSASFRIDSIRAYPADYELPEIGLDYVNGDVNDDGKVNSSDALLALQHSVGKIKLPTYSRYLADVVEPSGIDVYDALTILQVLVKKIEDFDSEYSKASVPSEYESYEPEPVTVPDSVVKNNAYGKDGEDGSDKSFSLTTLGIKPKTIYIVKSGVPEKSDHHGRFVYSLQGLFNREFGMDEEHTSIMFVTKDASDNAWLNYISANESVFGGFKTEIISSWSTFLRTFGPQIEQCGYITWDPNVPATSNVAATICGLDGYLPVMSGSVVEADLKAKGIKEKMSLVGRFTGATTGSPKNDAYRWALDNYFNRCSYDYLAYTVDGATDVEGNVVAADPDAMGNCIENHDYLIARRAFFFDLHISTAEAAKDAGGGKSGLDAETVEMIFDRRYQRAGGKFGVLMGFVPWWVKYALDCGNSTAGKHQSYDLEWRFCEMIACFNLIKEADAAHPVSMSNGSVFYKYTVADKFVNNKTAKVTSYNSNVHYLTLFIGDYDSSAWLKKYVAEFWFSDPSRGKVDLMWGINPNLSYRVPMCFEYMYDNLTDCDYMLADEGAGYVIPTGFFTGVAPKLYTKGRKSAYGNANQTYATFAKTFYDLCDMDMTGFLIMGGNALNTSIMDMYNQFSPNGTFHNYSTWKFSKRNGIPFVYCYQEGVAENTAHSSLYSHSFTAMSGYNFSCFRTISQSPTQIKNIVEQYVAYCAGRGKTVQYVDPYSFMSLAKSSGKLVAR